MPPSLPKLVRDRIPDLCRAEGKVPRYRRLVEDEAFRRALLDKLREETEEMQQTPCLDEAADILEVLLALGALEGTTEADLLHAARAKRDKRGGFAERIFLESIND